MPDARGKSDREQVQPREKGVEFTANEVFAAAKLCVCCMKTKSIKVRTARPRRKAVR